MQKPSQGDPTNPTTPTPKPQNHDPRTSQQNQPTTPPPKQQPGKPYRNPPPPSNPTRKHPKHSHHQEPHTQPPTAQHTLHTPPPPTQTHTHQPPEAFVWHASAGTQNRPGTAQLAAPGRIMIRTGQRVRAPTVFFPRRTRATRPHRKSSSVRR